MNIKEKKSLIVLTLIVIIVVSSSIYLLTENLLQSEKITIPNETPPEAQLKITGNVETEKTITFTDLLQLPLKSVKATVNGESATYVGVTLTELLNKTGAEWDAGFISVISDETIRCTIDVYQAFNSTLYEGSEIILAFIKNGQWITDNNGGTFAVIAPDLNPTSNVMSVNEINLQPWIITVNGKVSNPLIITSAELSAFEVKTVQATYAPGSGPQRTSNWTGITVSSILQIAEISSDSKTVTVSGIDGYSIEYTIEQVENLGIMLCFQENSVPLSSSTSQPYRLIVPTEDYKWAQFWVKWVSEIKIS